MAEKFWFIKKFDYYETQLLVDAIQEHVCKQKWIIESHKNLNGVKCSFKSKAESK